VAAKKTVDELASYINDQWCSGDKWS